MIDAYFSLIIFSFLLLGSPGPAPMAIAATGAVFGLKKGLYFLYGLVAGFVVVTSVQGVLLFYVIEQSPTVSIALQVFGALYVVYIAVKIARAPIDHADSTTEAPPDFLDGFILNISNPKAYAAVTVIYAQFLLPHDSLILAYVFTAVCCVIVVIFIDVMWLLLGKLLRPIMHQPKTGRLLRVVFAVSMVLVVLWVLVQDLVS